MSAPVVHGWCPGALRPMMSGDGLVVRVRAPIGRLTLDQAAGVARLAAEHGNGLIDMSARANVQIRGVRPESHSALIDGLTALGLIDRNVAAETRRNLVVQPFWSEGDTTHRIARTLTDALAQPDAPDLPGKFGFAVDCGPEPILRGTSADIRIERGENGLVLRPDGSGLAAPVTEATAAEAALDLARWFLDTGGAPEGRGRMARHLSSGAVLPGQFHETPAVAGATPPAPGATSAGQLVALEFGQITADSLAALAELAPIRVTPWRMLLLEGVTEAPDLPGLIHDAMDPRLAIDVCTGAPSCPQALSPTRDLARTLAPHLPAGQRLHISGCAKGCAHPGPAALTLTATGPDRFDLIRDGRADATPEAIGLAPDQIKKAL
ncbi:precorrin-3B synthase [Nioella sediminis]|jgi:precorrin-3B synthase|uniref:precorrin-3B synthase n=1 Tax=Nioella sediminis TaxID=1912092 RepID=UPI0008FD22CE|nr:precorrin-3B synthase [Nioella sediminis]TBX23522.1 precorrin-3B synthase [Roseovarius sp. JS7-11]